MDNSLFDQSGTHSCFDRYFKNIQTVPFRCVVPMIQVLYAKSTSKKCTHQIYVAMVLSTGAGGGELSLKRLTFNPKSHFKY